MNETIPAGQATGISLWLLPEAAERDRLAQVIGELAARLGTPVFDPHVTLLPGLAGGEGEVIRRAREMAATLEPHATPLGSVESREEYFRCVFARVPETLRLLTTHALARLTFRRTGEVPFEPHLSLVYGELRPAVKEPLVVELGSRLPARLAYTTLEVVRTEGAVADWRSLARFEMG